MKTVLLLALLITSCTSSTEFGECVGLNEEKQADLVYKYSSWNIAMGIIFSELVVPPIAVVLDALECPVGRKK